MAMSEQDAFAAVTAAAARENLGQYQMSFRPKRVGTAQLIIMLAMGILTVIIVVGVYFIVMAFMQPNLNHRQAAKRLHFFERGLIVATGDGPTAVYRWDSLTVLQSITRRYVYGRYTGTTYIYTLITRDGRQAKVTGFYEKPEEWGPAIQAEITAAQLPGVMAALQSGASLEFGPLVINRGGLATGSRTLPWSEIQAIEVQQGYLRIKRSNGWLRWSAKPVSQIPNFFVFVTAANQMHRAPTV